MRPVNGVLPQTTQVKFVSAAAATKTAANKNKMSARWRTFSF
jgi:hypothetical protein